MLAVQLCLERIAEKCVETQTNVDTSSKEPYPIQDEQPSKYFERTASVLNAGDFIGE